MSKKTQVSKPVIVRKKSDDSAVKNADLNDKNAVKIDEVEIEVDAPIVEKPTVNQVETVVKPKRKPPGNKRAYQLEELIKIVHMINDGKGLDEISKITGRPPASLIYKVYSSRGLLGIRTEEGVRKWWAERNQKSK